MKLKPTFKIGDEVIHKMYLNQKGSVEKVQGCMVTVLVRKKMHDGSYSIFYKVYNKKVLKKVRKPFKFISKFLNKL